MDSITQSFITGMNIDQQRKQQAIAEQQARMAMAMQLMQLKKMLSVHPLDKPISTPMGGITTYRDPVSGELKTIQGPPKSGTAAFTLGNKRYLPNPNAPQGFDIVEGPAKTETTSGPAAFTLGNKRYLPNPNAPQGFDIVEGPAKTEGTPEAVRTFEIQAFGKEVPELRGTPGYEAKLAAFKRLGVGPASIDQLLAKKVEDKEMNLLDAFRVRTGQGDESKYNIKGLDTKGRIVVEERGTGALVYQDDKTPYRGGQLQTLTESPMITMMTGQDTFADMPEKIKNVWYEQYEKDRSSVPPFYYRDPKSKNAFIEGFARWQLAKGQSGADVIAERAGTKALTVSLQQQQKNRGMMGSFVQNINDQVDKLEKMSQDIVKRVGVRALDYPLRELNTRFVGSGSENVFAAYMKEVSAEINKLSQGSTASVAQLPEGNRQEWEKIHDVNLSMKELLKVLKGTKEMANIRLKSVENEILRTRSQITGRPPNGDGMTSGGRSNGPKLGEVKKGYRFKGGDPSDKNSWEKVK